MLKNLVLLRAAGPVAEQDSELVLRARKFLPDDPQIARALARLAYERKDYAQAVTLLPESSRKLAETAKSLTCLGLCRYHLGDKVKARQTLERAIALDPKRSGMAEVFKVMLELK